MWGKSNSEVEVEVTWDSNQSVPGGAFYNLIGEMIPERDEVHTNDL